MFPITMSFTVSTPADLARLVAASTGLPVAIGSAAAQAATTTKAEPAKKDQKAEKAASDAPPADTPATPATTGAPAGDKPIDFTSQVQKPIVAMAAGGRRTEALAILKELGASKASEIKPEDYARAVELIAKAG